MKPKTMLPDGGCCQKRRPRTRTSPHRAEAEIDQIVWAAIMAIGDPEPRKAFERYMRSWRPPVS